MDYTNLSSLKKKYFPEFSWFTCVCWLLSQSNKEQWWHLTFKQVSRQVQRWNVSMQLSNPKRLWRGCLPTGASQVCLHLEAKNRGPLKYHHTSSSQWF
jgi:hypothetical protein